MKETTRHKEDPKMKKMSDIAGKIALAALCTITAGALVGCSSDDKETKTTSLTKKMILKIVYFFVISIKVVIMYQDWFSEVLRNN